jgi:alpha-glucoside transport system permease protein
MVLLAAAIKNVPVETIEAARVDGAGGWSIFRRIVAPQIKGTIIVVLTTIALLMLKVFDIVYTNTAGLFKTDVVGNQFFLSLFRYSDPGAAAVLVVLLLVLVFPFMLLNIRRFVESSSG